MVSRRAILYTFQISEEKLNELMRRKDFPFPDLFQSGNIPYWKKEELESYFSRFDIRLKLFPEPPKRELGEGTWSTIKVGKSEVRLYTAPIKEEEIPKSLEDLLIEYIDEIETDRKKDVQWYRSMTVLHKLKDILKAADPKNPSPRFVDKRSSA